jgi:TPR repeat protein
MAPLMVPSHGLGKGVKKDKARPLSLLRRACELGRKDACT